MSGRTSAISQSSKYRLAGVLRPGDLVFIRVSSPLFSQVAAVTGSWTNHVGIAVLDRHGKLQIAESRVPLACLTTPLRFVRRSEGRRVAILRLPTTLTAAQAEQLGGAVRRRLGTPYDTGFNLHSRRQFCSRFVHEVLQEATGQAFGEVQTFSELLLHSPNADLAFWRWWFVGRIPWSRQTLTPASLLASTRLRTVFDGTLCGGHTSRRR
jgi:Permuted papain-like amidase enzyme, YaeF/YiiX, C92 family